MTKIEKDIICTVDTIRKNNSFNEENLPLTNVHLRQKSTESNSTFSERQIKFARKIAFVDTLSKISGKDWKLSTVRDGQFKYYTAENNKTRIFIGTSNSHDYSSIPMSTLQSLKKHHSYLILGNNNLSKTIMTTASKVSSRVRPEDTFGKSGFKYLPIEKLQDRFSDCTI